MRNMIIKMILLGLMLCVGKASVLAQDVDIKCEISGLDHNLSGKPGYLIEFGSFSMFENDGHGMITKFYKLPQTKLILSVFAGHHPKDEPKPIEDVLIMSMVLGKKRISPLSDEPEEMTKYAVGVAQAWYPMEIFDKGSEGLLHTSYLGKRKPIQIVMTCRKAGS